MPLPAALAARLAKRGIIQKQKKGKPQNYRQALDIYEEYLNFMRYI